MKKEQFKKYRDILMSKKNEILSSVKNEEKQGLESSEPGAKDPYDAATDAYDQEFSFTISEAGRRTLEEIDIALHKIDEGTYGTCDGCKKPIDQPRLDAVPQARMCISCQEKEESSAT